MVLPPNPVSTPRRDHFEHAGIHQQDRRDALLEHVVVRRATRVFQRPMTNDVVRDKFGCVGRRWLFFSFFSVRSQSMR